MRKTDSLRDAFGLACPKCGEDDRLKLRITCEATLTVDGSHADGEHEWDAASFCRCPGCGYTATVGKFTASQAAPIDNGGPASGPLAAVILDIARRELRLETLQARNADELDFHDLGVWSIERALVAAYCAGSELQSELVAALTALVPLAQREAAHLANTDCVEEADAAQAAIDAAHRLITDSKGGRS